MTTYAIETNHLCKSYGKKEIIHDLNLKINQGEIFGLLGQNGAGKTTLMKIISGLSKLTSGSLRIFGEDANNRTAELKKKIGLIPQENNLEREFTVEEALKIYAMLFGIKNVSERVEEIIARFDLEEMRKKIVRNLSGGMMRRVLIARALLTDPKLLLLDEPTVGLDPDVRQGIWKELKELKQEGKTLILTTHYMEEAERLCDTIAIFKQGKIVLCDGRENLQKKIGADAKNLEELFIQLSK